MAMRIGIIGYKNHAGRLIEIIAQRKDVKELWVFHPKRERLSNFSFPSSLFSLHTTAIIEDLFGLDAVFISSPSETHYSYIFKLVDKVNYLFCEKPPGVNQTELNNLLRLKRSQRKKILFNFMFSRSPLSNIVRGRTTHGNLGDLVHASFSASQGLAYKPGFENNWRFTKTDIFSSIAGNLGVHYVHLILELFGNAEVCFFKKSAVATKSGYDTSYFALSLSKKQCASVLLSYAAPCLQEATVLFSNGIITLNNGVVEEHKPRDIFDQSGRFTPPPKELLFKPSSSNEFYDLSLSNMIDFFFSTLQRQGSFDDKQFFLGIKASHLILDMESYDQLSEESA
jgi:predicted dehydrogenase